MKVGGPGIPDTRVKSWARFEFLRNGGSLGEDHGKSRLERVTKIDRGHQDITVKGQESFQIPDH